jgi:hypothetical protein
MNKIQPTGKTFNISGIIIEQVDCEPCLRFSQYMKEEPITCSCSSCLIDNKGMTSEQITARMDNVNKNH